MENDMRNQYAFIEYFLVIILIIVAIIGSTGGLAS
jgi:hypothetical protein